MPAKKKVRFIIYAKRTRRGSSRTRAYVAEIFTPSGKVVGRAYGATKAVAVKRARARIG
jgi:hypothetical protein